MANPLARVIMNNISQNSGKVDMKANSVNSAYTVSSLDNKEERLLLGLINKKPEKTIKSNDHDNQRSNCFEKVKLEDLIKGGSKLDSNTYTSVKRSNTMMTLDELAGKAKNASESETLNTSYPAQEKNSNNDGIYVKTGIINNLEAYIPKVSLDSIGKKGSLLK